jgi:UDP-N-acetylmuramoyl-L-alanyl-D-glutamate--2,6-diaminopimelate ligase
VQRVKLSLWTSELATLVSGELLGSDVQLKSASLSAQEVLPGGLFIAIQGAKHHGLEFAQQAIDCGAAAILSDRPAETTLPVVIATNIREKLGEICGAIYGDVGLDLFAVTGTNGKTSTVSYLRDLLSATSSPAALAASTGMEFKSASRSNPLTSPELPMLRQFLADARSEGAKAAAIEVSAQALVRQRVEGLRFKVAGFTGLSRDHLDDFGSMENYLAAKARLFDSSRSEAAVVFLADSFSEQLAGALQIPTTTIGVGGDVGYRYQNSRIELTGAVTLSAEFFGGELMARNLALACVMLAVSGAQPSELERAIPLLGKVPGRLELVSPLKPHCYVDYAHTPDGIASAVAELSGRYPGVTLVFGASGDRDAGKRELMGQAAAKANLVVLTDQHPRSENPADIRAAVASGLSGSGADFVELADPAGAIEYAVKNTPREHAVLWCGPGHLKYREIAGNKVPFDAIEIARLTVENNA